MNWFHCGPWVMQFPICSVSVHCITPHVHLRWKHVVPETSRYRFPSNSWVSWVLRQNDILAMISARSVQWKPSRDIFGSSRTTRPGWNFLTAQRHPNHWFHLTLLVAYEHQLLPETHLHTFLPGPSPESTQMHLKPWPIPFHMHPSLPQRMGCGFTWICVDCGLGPGE